MRTPEQYYDPINEALNFNTEVSKNLTKEQALRRVQYVFNPSSPINTRERYPEYPLLHRGRWTMIGQSVSQTVILGGLNDLAGPQQGTKPIYPQWIAEEYVDAYAYLGVRTIASFTDIDKSLALLAQQVIMPVLPATNPEMLAELEAKIIKQRIKENTQRLEAAAEKFGVNDIVQRCYQAAELMYKATKINCDDIAAYIQRSLNEVSEGRAGRPGKTILDACDLQYMELMGVPIADDLLAWQIKPQQDVAQAVTLGVREAISGLQSQGFDEERLAKATGIAVVQALVAFGFTPQQQPQPAIQQIPAKK